MRETEEIIARALQIFEYRDGRLFWKEKAGKKVAIGARAGWSHPVGIYRYVKINGVCFLEHRVVWAMHNNAWPKYEIDHINRVRNDNRIENLRCVTHVQNQANLPLRKDNKYGHTGIRWRSDRNKWQAYVHSLGKFVSIGHFQDKKMAIEARLAYLGGRL